MPIWSRIPESFCLAIVNATGFATFPICLWSQLTSRFLFLIVYGSTNQLSLHLKKVTFDYLVNCHSFQLCFLKKLLKLRWPLFVLLKQEIKRNSQKMSKTKEIFLDLLHYVLHSIYIIFIWCWIDFEIGW